MMRGTISISILFFIVLCSSDYGSHSSSSQYYYHGVNAVTTSSSISNDSVSIRRSRRRTSIHPSQPLSTRSTTTTHLLQQPVVEATTSSTVKIRPFNLWDNIRNYQNHRRRRYDFLSNSILRNSFLVLTRGGATITTPTNHTTTSKNKSSNKKKSKKKKKKQTKTANTSTIPQQLPSKDVINDKLKDEDSAAQSLGDAIRQNAHLILNRNDDDDDETTSNALESLGHAMGSSDYTTSVLSQYSKLSRKENGDRRRSASWNSSSKSKMAQELTSPTAVIVHYFLKSHGGIHLLQCLCSSLASLAGIGSLLWYHNRSLQYTLIQRTLFFGMCKHISGVIMAIYLVARTVSRPGGFHEATQSIQSLIRDPISQYVFYTACVLIWLPSSSTVTTLSSKTSPPLPVDSSGAKSAMAAPVVTGLVWWQQYAWVPTMLVGPVVLREFISMALVISDVLTLIIATTAGSDTSTTTYIERLLKVTHAIVDAMMSILVTPSKWRPSSAAQRQALLARLVSKVSLLMEVGVGILMLCDCLVMSLRYVFVNTGGQIRFYALLKSIICTRLYIGFLWTRRKNISKLVESIRGGAVEAPIYMLDVLLHPSSSMGIGLTPHQPSSASTTTSTKLKNLPSQSPSPESARGEKSMENKRTWLDYIRVALDMNDP